MLRTFRTIFVSILVLCLLAPAMPAQVAQANGTINFTILHTNDFHGQLEPVDNTEFPDRYSNPGAARTAYVINQIRAAKGAENVALFDGGDMMQGSLLSNLQKGEPTIAYYRAMGYNAVAFGNHEFDWGQDALRERVTQGMADPGAIRFLAANITEKDDSGNCTWDSPDFAEPYTIVEVGATGSKVKLGVIGVGSVETPFITIAEATEGLCFRDPYESIAHYYDALNAAADVLIVLSHNGLEDGGYGYGITVYGDKTLAGKLNTAGKPVDLIIGAHSHTDVSTDIYVGSTLVVQAHYNGRKVGQVDFVYNPDTDTVVSMTRTRNVVDLLKATVGIEDTAIKTLINTYSSDPDYTTLINQEIGYTNVPIIKYYDGDSLMGYFVNDAIYGALNEDADPSNDVDLVFNNPGGLRADIGCGSPPCLMTYGALFNVLPFGNATAVGEMTGAQIVELLNQSATLFKGALQIGGGRYKFFRYTSNGTSSGVRYAWGAYDIMVWDKTTSAFVPIDLEKTYKVATNEFLAPAGQDGFTAFKYFKNITYWGDMLNQVLDYVKTHYGTPATAYNGALDGRITRDGDKDDAYEPGIDSIVPLTILHHNDSHGRLLKSGSNVGFTQLVTAIQRERAYNPDRTLLLSAGDNLQGDAMMYYFRTAPTGFASDGAAIADTGMHINPFIKAMNALNYDAMTLGNHEFNFGKDVFVSTFQQANFPVLQANITDDGSYGLAAAGVDPFTFKTVGSGIDVAILGVGNHRIPSYELPSNIPGLTFTDPIEKAKELTPTLDLAADVVIALTHIGFTTNPSSVEVDNNVDTYLASEVSGIDVIVGGHSHTDPSKKTSASGDYQYLPAVLPNPDGAPVLVSQSYRYNTYLGKISIGLRVVGGDLGPTALNYEVVSRAGENIKINVDTEVEDSTVKALIDPYNTLLDSYKNTAVGQTENPIDAREAYTAETNGANLQADASVWELEDHAINVDFHLSGAMSNTLIASGATSGSPANVTINDLFSSMPYENSLVVIRMNGPQLKAVLERSYRNYYYYKYVLPDHGGYSYYTTCFLDTNAGNVITYNDLPLVLPNGDNVESLVINGVPVDFTDAATYYNVSTVNYLAAGSCNFSDNGVTLWPLNQIVADTQYYVRDAVINYMDDQSGPIAPAIEGRIVFNAYDSVQYMPIISR